jgi:hypothetical protein
LEIKGHIVKSDNYQIFCYQCDDVIKMYPNLSIQERDGRKYLKGILDVPNKNLEIIGSYLIEIHFTDLFPLRFPKLFEIGCDIPNDINWHKFSDGRCCITVLPDEILKCKQGITLNSFIRTYCFSFLANHIHRKLTGSYLNGEYGHGVEGVKEFYSDLFKTNNIDEWVKYLKHVFLVPEMRYKRNDLCFCKSELKFKHCHLEIFNSIRDIGAEQCLYDFKRINTLQESNSLLL